ncbi:hypothetical protein CC2G_004235 [Coprinopsis cinerea AmutBmut pab1-1]|nr:hypothetical protein CC2G_004235 [Coprinopsis cinerea AmutBmut pab1-1]
MKCRLTSKYVFLMGDPPPSPLLSSLPYLCCLLPPHPNPLMMEELGWTAKVTLRLHRYRLQRDIRGLLLAFPSSSRLAWVIDLGRPTLITLPSRAFCATEWYALNEYTLHGEGTGKERI